MSLGTGGVTDQLIKLSTKHSTEARNYRYKEVRDCVKILIPIIKCIMNFVTTIREIIQRSQHINRFDKYYSCNLFVILKKRRN